MPEIAHANAATREDRAAVTLGEVSLACAWNIRGNPAQAAFVAEVPRGLGLALPLEPMTSTSGDAGVMLWLGPRSWLFVAGARSPPNAFDATRKALDDRGGALFDVSASYVASSITGAAAARVLNRSCPLDFHPRVFPAGHCAQSVLGHINALFYKPDEPPAFIVMVARSLAADAWDGLCASAAADGYRTAPPTPFPAAGQ